VTKEQHGESAAASASPKAGHDKWAITLFLVCTVGFLAADLGFKWWTFKNVAGVPVILDRANPGQHSIPEHPPIVVLPNVLSLRLLTNTGAVFGMAKGAQAFFIVVSVVATVVIALLFYHSKPDSRTVHFALALILSGALGNLYDRIAFNAVRDMLWLFPDVHLPFGLSWPGGVTYIYPWLFNIADAALVVGVLMMMATMWRAEGAAKRAAFAESPTES